MTDPITCFRCGASLAALSLPLSRQDCCPGCGVYLHVCRMCAHYDPAVPRACREDDAEDVKEKERPNFCDYFEATAGAFDAAAKRRADSAGAALDALFGAEAEVPEADDALAEAEKLFR